MQCHKISATGAAVLQLRGILDETFQAREVARLASAVTVFDMEGVDIVTSFGVREWLYGLRLLAAREVVFIRCQPAVVSQFNMVAQFGGTGQLVSLFAPYMCDSCGAETRILLDLRKTYASVAAGQLPEVACHACGGPTQFDDIAESYFSYVTSHPPPTISSVATKLIDGEPSSTEMPLSVEKQIMDDITVLSFSGALRAAARLDRVMLGLEGETVIHLAGLTAMEPAGATKLAEAISRVAGKLVLADVPANFLPLLEQEPVFARRVVSSLPEKEIPEPLRAQISPTLRTYFDRGPVSSRAFDAVETTHTRRYNILQKIGEGGMAEVFLARLQGPEGFRKTVVLKRILPAYASNPDFIEMFLEEAKLAARIAHPNVVDVLDLGRDDDQYFMALEVVDGPSLRTLLSAVRVAGSSVPLPIACRIVADACAGLHAAHTSANELGEPTPIIHCDVSPENILISRSGIVKVADFGIARLQGGAASLSALRGKSAYMAPEQYIDNTKVDARTDIYALGITLLEMLAPSAASLTSVISQDPAPVPGSGRDKLTVDLNEHHSKFMTTLPAMGAPREVNPMPNFEQGSGTRPIAPPLAMRTFLESQSFPEVWPASLKATLSKALSKSPEGRQASCLAFRAELEAVLIELHETVGPATLADWVAQLGQEQPKLVRKS